MTELGKRIKQAAEAAQQAAGGLVNMAPLIASGGHSPEIFQPTAAHYLEAKLHELLDGDQIEEINRWCRQCMFSNKFSRGYYLKIAYDKLMAGEEYDAVRYWLWQECRVHPEEEFKTLHDRNPDRIFKTSP